MVFRFLNEKTGKKEKHVQCLSCLDFIPESEYFVHCEGCKKNKINIGNW